MGVLIKRYIRKISFRVKMNFHTCTTKSFSVSVPKLLRIIYLINKFEYLNQQVLYYILGVTG